MGLKDGGLRTGGLRNLSEIGAPPASGVARLTFDNADTPGGTATDVWGDYDGTISGATTGVSGANQTYNTNEAYSFDGTDDSVDLGGTAFVDLFQNSSFSICLWAYMDSTGDHALFNYHNAYPGIGYERQGSNGFDAGIYDGSFNIIESGNSVTNSWQHHVLTYDSSNNTAEYYIDASSQGSVSSGNATLNRDRTVIGNRSDGNYPFAGDIDDVRVYSKALSSTEVSNLYNTGSISG